MHTHILCWVLPYLVALMNGGMKKKTETLLCCVPLFSLQRCQHPPCLLRFGDSEFDPYVFLFDFTAIYLYQMRLGTVMSHPWLSYP
jgi:hypothetical protein